MKNSSLSSLADLATNAERRGKQRNSSARYHEPSAPSAENVPRSVFASYPVPFPEIPVTKFPEHATHYMLWLTKQNPVAVIRCDRATREHSFCEEPQAWLKVDRVCTITMITDDHRANCPTPTASPPQGCIVQTVDNIVLASLRFKAVDPEYLCNVEFVYQPSSNCFQSVRKRIGLGNWFRGKPIRVVPLPEGINSMIPACHLIGLMLPTRDDEECELERLYDDKIDALIYAAIRGRGLV